jgi:hypothetical protein
MRRGTGVPPVQIHGQDGRATTTTRLSRATPLPRLAKSADLRSP